MVARFQNLQGASPSIVAPPGLPEGIGLIVHGGGEPASRSMRSCANYTPVFTCSFGPRGDM
jgi:hypothetical protein